MPLPLWCVIGSLLLHAFYARDEKRNLLTLFTFWTRGLHLLVGIHSTQLNIIWNLTLLTGISQDIICWSKNLLYFSTKDHPITMKQQNCSKIWGIHLQCGLVDKCRLEQKAKAPYIPTVAQSHNHQIEQLDSVCFVWVAYKSRCCYSGKAILRWVKKRLGHVLLII